VLKLGVVSGTLNPYRNAWTSTPNSTAATSHQNATRGTQPGTQPGAQPPSQHGRKIQNRAEHPTPQKCSTMRVFVSTPYRYSRTTTNLEFLSRWVHSYNCKDAANVVLFEISFYLILILGHFVASKPPHDITRWWRLDHNLSFTEPSFVSRISFFDGYFFI